VGRIDIKREIWALICDVYSIMARKHACKNIEPALTRSSELAREHDKSYSENYLGCFEASATEVRAILVLFLAKKIILKSGSSWIPWSNTLKQDLFNSCAWHKKLQLKQEVCEEIKEKLTEEIST
jgi:hypothetical protein